MYRTVGNVKKISDKRTNMSDRSVNYVYDALNRIKEAYTDGTSGNYCWGEAFTVDALANLTNTIPWACGVVL